LSGLNALGAAAASLALALALVLERGMIVELDGAGDKVGSPRLTFLDVELFAGVALRLRLDPEAAMSCVCPMVFDEAGSALQRDLEAVGSKDGCCSFLTLEDAAPL